MARPQILLTNDDGIRSPGLWAAAGALSALGYVTVAAPEEQGTGMGRSMPTTSTGVIKVHSLDINGQHWQAYGVQCSPAQAVLYAVLEIMSKPPDLIVSGINYGENVGPGITISGTVGAALEGAALGIPALAISLETDKSHYLTYSEEVDFSTAAHFSCLFGKSLLTTNFPPELSVLKIDVPCDATPQTPWVLNRLSLNRYYNATLETRTSYDQPARFDYEVDTDPANYVPGTDMHTLRILRQVAVTPLGLDLTARVDFNEVEQTLRTEKN